MIIFSQERVINLFAFFYRQLMSKKIGIMKHMLICLLTLLK